MPGLLSLVGQFELFVLVACRTSGIFLAAPAVSSPMVPSLVKVLACASVAFCLMPVAAQGQGELMLSTTWLGFGLAAAKELLVGLALGLFALMAYSGVQIAGELVSEQMGFAMSVEVDPTTESEMTVISQFATVLALLLFMAVDGHHWLLGALAKSYERLPVGTFELREVTMTRIVNGFSRMFESGIVLSAPVLCATLLTTFAVGIVARVVPQIDTLAMSFPLRVAIGLMVLGAALPFVAHAAERQFAAIRHGLLPLLVGR